MVLALIPGIGSFGGTELIIALVIILLLFGAKRIPELARGLGSGVKEFRAGTREGQLEEKKNEEKPDEEQTASAEDKAGTRVEDEPSVETERAEIAWRLGKRYVQDEPLDWGCSAERPAEDSTRFKDAGHTLRARVREA